MYSKEPYISVHAIGTHKHMSPKVLSVGLATLKRALYTLKEPCIYQNMSQEVLSAYLRVQLLKTQKNPILMHTGTCEKKKKV